MLERARHRLDFLEGMRGLAALYVVIGHFCSMADPRAFQRSPSFAPLWTQRLMAPFWHGHLAVAAFIVISGFSLQMSLLDGGDGGLGGLWRFYGRRARRILPPYYACLAISLAVALTITPKLPGMPFAQYLPASTEAIVAHALLIHNLNPAWMYKINGALWSIGAEAQLYLLFPLIAFSLRKEGRIFAFALFGTLALVPTILAPSYAKLYPWYLALFALGAIAAHAAYRPNLKKGVRPIPARIFGWAAFLLAAVGSAQDLPLAATDAAMGLGIASLLYSGACAPKALSIRLLGVRPLVALGTISYSLYLMHHPLQQIVFYFRPAWAMNEAGAFEYLAGVGLPIIFVATIFFWAIFERPFQRRKVKRIAKLAVVDASGIKSNKKAAKR